MTSTGRVFVAVLLLSMVTIELGGQFLLSILQRKQKVDRKSVQFSLFRAGHAHAGVLVLLALIVMPYIEMLHAGSTMKLLLRIGFGAAPIMVSAGFFAAGGAANDDKPGSAISVVYAGAVVLAASLVGLGVELLRTV
jgi:hypothetical protein